MGSVGSHPPLLLCSSRFPTTVAFHGRRQRRARLALPTRAHHHRSRAPTCIISPYLHHTPPKGRRTRSPEHLSPLQPLNNPVAITSNFSLSYTPSSSFLLSYYTQYHRRPRSPSPRLPHPDQPQQTAATPSLHLVLCVCACLLLVVVNNNVSGLVA